MLEQETETLKIHYFKIRASFYVYDFFRSERIIMCNDLIIYQRIVIDYYFNNIYLWTQLCFYFYITFLKKRGLSKYKRESKRRLVLKNDVQNVLDCITRVCETISWDWCDESRHLIWKWPNKNEVTSGNGWANFVHESLLRNLVP